MNSQEQLSAELSAVAVWLDLRDVDWCVFGDAGGEYEWLEVAVDADAPVVAAILHDFAGEGMRVETGAYPHVAQARGQWLQVYILYGCSNATTLARSAIRSRVLGQQMPVAAELVREWQRRADALAARHRRAA